MLCERKKMVILNANAIPLVCKVQDNLVDSITTTEERKKSSKVSETLEKDITKLHNSKGDKVENENKN